MFHVIDSKSFKAVSAGAIPSESLGSAVPSSAPPFSVRTPKVTDRNIVIGASNRSRSGCLVCRRRKKKCDETYPVCNACKLRDATCEWGPNKPSSLKYDASIPGGKIAKLSKKLHPSKQMPLTAVTAARAVTVPVPVPNYTGTNEFTTDAYVEFPYEQRQQQEQQQQQQHQHQHQQQFVERHRQNSAPHIQNNEHQHLQNHVQSHVQSHVQNHVPDHVQNHVQNQEQYGFQNYSKYHPQSQLQPQPHPESQSHAMSRSQSLSQMQPHFDHSPSDPGPNPVSMPVPDSLEKVQHGQHPHSRDQEQLTQVIEELYTPNAHHMSKTTTPIMASVAEFINGSGTPWMNSASSLFQGGTATPNFAAELENLLSQMSAGPESELYGNAMQLDVVEDPHSVMTQQLLHQLLNANTPFESIDLSTRGSPLLLFLQQAYSQVSPTNSMTPPVPFHNLDEIAMYFMRGFIEKVAHELCIGPESSNYLLRTFFQLAGRERSISYALSSWGGLFLNDEGSKQYVQQYREKANQLMLKKRSNPPTNEKYDTYVYLNYNMIQMSIDVCAGDTKVWHEFFKENVKLIQKEGGIVNMCQSFGNSEHILWLLADVQYHDILSSKAFAEGTIFPISEYNKIFGIPKKENEDQHGMNFSIPKKNGDAYGIDPLQGCLQPIFLLLGDILNVSVDMKKLYEIIQHELSKAEARFERTGHIEDLNPIIHSQTSNLEQFSRTNPELLNLRTQRIKYFSQVQEHYGDFKEKIRSCSPMQLQLHDLQNDTKEMELHQTLFKIYVQVVSACLEIQLRRAPSGSHELQCLLPQIFVYIDMLVDTKMASSLCLAFLVCGIICIEPADRHYLELQYGKIKKNYHVKNFERTWEIVGEIWKRNDHGRKYIDWVDICEEKDWVLCLS